MKISRIILFNPVSSARRTPVLPMSLLAIEAALEGRWPTVIVDGNLINDSLEHLEAAIDGAEATTILAVTVMPGPQLEHATPLCRELKQRHPELTIVWGGYFPSQHWEACLGDPAIDFVLPNSSEISRIDLDHIKPVCAINTSLIIIDLRAFLVTIHAEVLDQDMVIIKKKIRIPELGFFVINDCYRPFVRKTDLSLLEVVPNPFLSIRLVMVPQLVLVRHEFLKIIETYISFAKTKE